MPYTIKPGSFKYKKSNGQFSEIDCFEGPDLTEEVTALEKGKAPIIIDSATGNPIAIKDGADGLPVEGMKIHFSPVQSGTGDPSPSNIRPIDGWIGINAYRAGKNLFDPAKIDRTSTIYNIRVYKNDPILLPAGTYTMSCSEECNGLYVEQGSSDIFTKYNSTFLTFTLNEATKVSFNFYMVNAFASDTVVQLEVGSVATSYTPYVGISCPVMFPALGKNLLPNKKCISGDNIFFGTDETKSPYINVHSITLPSGTYTVSVETQDTSVTNLYVAEVGNSATIALQYNTKTLTFTISKTTDLRIWAYKNGYGQIGTGAITSFQLETGDTATTYEPYKYVYGGTLDVINRVLTVKWAKTFLNGSETGWNYYNQNTAFSVPIVGMKNVSVKQVICDRFRQIKNIVDYGVYAGAVNEYAYFIRATDIEGVSDMDSWKAYLAENPIEFAFELATPYEIQLDPITITTLLGDNMIWSDANSTIELDYRADTKLFCQKNDQVNDVQINGTSILDAQGVANMPVAGSNNLGLVKLGTSTQQYGLSVNANGIISIARTNAEQIKAGTDMYRPIVTSVLDAAVFYGLAKLAGADMAQSSNPVGQFTDDALVKIQKMLGVYQAPWELIRQDSATNETSSDIEITVDGNGISLALTDLALQLTIPADSNTIISSYGMINLFYYTGADTYVPVMLNNFSGPKQHAWFGSVYANCVNGFVQASCSQYSESGNNRPVQVRNTFDFFPASSSAIIKIVIKNVQGTIDYKLYGRRKWTT